MNHELERDINTRVPTWVLAVALLASAIHMAPYWLKQSSTPPGWTFSGNTTMSPDLMQYRVWMRQAPVEGVVVSNRLTAEESRPYLPVLSYYGIGKASQWTGVRPESLYAYARDGLTALRGRLQILERFPVVPKDLRILDDSKGQKAREYSRAPDSTFGLTLYRLRPGGS